MISNIAVALMQSFPKSYVNYCGDFIAHSEANEYFNLRNCRSETELRCKVLEWLSRSACKSEPFKSKKKNDEFNTFMLDGINYFLGTEFSVDDMRIIYQKLGNQVNRKLTIKFIESGYFMNVLIDSEMTTFVERANQHEMLFITLSKGNSADLWCEPIDDNVSVRRSIKTQKIVGFVVNDSVGDYEFKRVGDLMHLKIYETDTMYFTTGTTVEKCAVSQHISEM